MDNIGNWITYWGNVNENKEMVVYKDRRITYYEMNKRINRLANVLREKFDVQKGDRVLNLLGNRLEYLEIILACSKLGALIVPVNIRLVSTEVEYIVGNADPKVIFTENDLSDKLEGIKDNNKYKNIINIDESVYEDLVNDSHEAEPDNQATWDDDFGILYTSGTTGLPKGAILSQKNIRMSADNLITAKGYTFNERIGIVLPLCFTGTLINITPVFRVGGTIILDSDFDPGRYLEMIEKEKITILIGVPTIYKFMYDHPNFESTDFSSVREGTVGGASIALPIIEAYRKKNVPIGVTYGLTEGSGINLVAYPEYFEKNAALKPGLWNDIRIVDDNGNDVETGEVGEILIKGPTVFKGYWKNPTATAETIKEGWLYTGDLAKQEVDGLYYIVDRKKDMIKTGGINVYGAEVENVLYDHPSVKEGAIIGVPHPDWDEAVVAVITLKPGYTFNKDEMFKFFRERLADYKCPKEIIVIDQMPLSVSGKILKKELREANQDLFMNKMDVSK